jgi:DNA-binding MarR family transcriptional regulator
MSGPVDAWAFTTMITRLRRVLRAAIRSEYPWETLPMAQVELLQRLAEEPGLRVRDLADRHRLAPNTISNLIQQMVTDGLVSRSPDEADRRAVTVELTPAGHRSLDGWLDAHARRFHAALAALSTADQRAIGRALAPLSRLVAELEAHEQASDTADRSDG